MIENNNSIITVHQDKPINELDINTNTIIEDYKKSIDVQDVTKINYISSIKGFIKWLQDNNKTQVNSQVLIEYKKYLSNNLTTGGSVNQNLIGVRSFFNYLQTKGLPNIMANVKGMRKGKGHTRQPLTKQQAIAIQDNAKRETLQDKRDYAIYQLSLRNALREIEIERSNIEDLSIINGQQVLYLQGKYQDTKSEYVVLCETVSNAINDYLQTRKEYKMNEPLFIGVATNKYGTRLTTRSIRRILTKLLIDNNFKSKRVVPHSLRHTAITSVAVVSRDILQTKAFARHSDINTTTIYIHENQRIENAPEHIIENYFNERNEIL